MNKSTLTKILKFLFKGNKMAEIIKIHDGYCECCDKNVKFKAYEAIKRLLYL